MNFIKKKDRNAGKTDLFLVRLNFLPVVVFTSYFLLPSVLFQGDNAEGGLAVGFALAIAIVIGPIAAVVVLSILSLIANIEKNLRFLAFAILFVSQVTLFIYTLTNPLWVLNLLYLIFPG